MRKLFLLSFIIFGSFVISASAQDRPADREVSYDLVIGRDAHEATVKKQIKLGTTHVYKLKADQGRYIVVMLKTGNQTSFTIYSPTEGIIDDADGQKNWSGSLKESGEYLISIGTDKTANYTLEVYIK
jgi:hypothetical protein